jgi:RNA recognition motif-containing protein
MTDRRAEKSRGFTFVVPSADHEAGKAVARLNGKEFDRRALKVNEARPRVVVQFGFFWALRRVHPRAKLRSC